MDSKTNDDMQSDEGSAENKEGGKVKEGSDEAAPDGFFDIVSTLSRLVSISVSLISEFHCSSNGRPERIEQ